MFSISTDGERFHETYATVEEAIQGAMDDLGRGHRETVWVGEVGLRPEKFPTPPIAPLGAQLSFLRSELTA